MKYIQANVESHLKTKQGKTKNEIVKGVNLKTSHFILGIYLLFHGPLYNFHNCYPNKYESAILKVSKMGWNISVGENSAEILHFKDR